MAFFRRAAKGLGFAVLIAAGVAYAAGPPQPVAIGQTVQGALTTSDGADPDDREDIYEFSGVAGQVVTFTVQSAAFPPEFIVKAKVRPRPVITEGGSLVMPGFFEMGHVTVNNVPQGAIDNAARAGFAQRRLTLPDTGSYHFIIRSAGNSGAPALGRYSASVLPQGAAIPPPPPPVGPRIVAGLAYHGQLAQGDHMPSDTFLDTYTFMGRKGQLIHPKAISGSFPPVVGISGHGLDVRGYAVSLEPKGRESRGVAGVWAKLPRDGLYAVTVGGTKQPKSMTETIKPTGAYLLTLVEGDGPKWQAMGVTTSRRTSQAWNYPNRKAAEAAALASCQKTYPAGGCVVAAAAPVCVAVARNSGGGASGGSGATAAVAGAIAAADCRDRFAGGTCTVIGTVCAK